MKTPHLISSLAIAVSAAATELRDPAEVARAWDESTAPKMSPSDALGLRDTTKPPSREVLPTPPVLRDKSKDYFEVPPWGAPGKRRPPRPETGLDSPRNRSLDVLPNNVPMPKGAQPWLYGGQTYWVLPLIPSRER